MPSRLLREGILDSAAVNELSFPAEVFYRRLMSVVDDFGRFDARPAVLRGRLYALRLDTVKEAEVAGWLEECERAGLVMLYQVNAKPYLLFKNLGIPRAKESKYPEPDCPDSDSMRGAYRSNALVYFIRDGEAGAVKIGSALCPATRLRELQTANSQTLTLLGTQEGGHAREKELHRRFALQRIRSDGEWFAISGELALFLQQEGWL